FHLSQEKERLTAEVRRLLRQRETNRRVSENYKQNIEPELSQLCSLMGLESIPVSLDQMLRHPQNAKDKLDKIIVPEKIDHNSDIATKRYNKLKFLRTEKTAELRKLQREAASINKHIQEEGRFIDKISRLQSPKQVEVSALVCPF
ncbi:ATPase, partial [Vibrio parahaemolyticus]